MADMVSVLNTILANGTGEYAARVPSATRTNITTVGNAILSYSATTNEFLSALVNKIAMTIVHNKTITNPLSTLKRGGVPLGTDIEEIFTNPATATAYDATGADLLARVEPDTKVIYHRMNRQDKYKVTFNMPQLMQAFTSYEKLEQLLNSVVSSLYSGDNYDEFILMKNTIASAITNSKMITVESADVVSEATAKSFVKDVRNAVANFQFPSSNWNSYFLNNGVSDPKKVVTWTPKEDQVLLIRSDIMTDISVDVLAQAFNMDKTDLLAQTMEVDSFGAADDCMAVLADKAFFQVYDNFETTEQFYNPEGLYTNYIRHHWQTYSLSMFANAVAFCKPAI